MLMILWQIEKLINIFPQKKGRDSSHDLLFISLKSLVFKDPISIATVCQKENFTCSFVCVKFELLIWGHFTKFILY